VRAFKKQQQLGRFDPDKVRMKEELEKQRLLEEEEALKHLSVDSRCEVNVPGQIVRRGTVKFIGMLIRVLMLIYIKPRFTIKC